MQKNITLYRFYTSALLRAVRLLFFFGVIIWILGDTRGGHFPNLSLFLLQIFVMLEVFFHAKIAIVTPKTPVVDSSSQQPIEQCTKPAADALLNPPSLLLRSLLSQKNVWFILEKAVITEKELGNQEVSSEGLVSKATELVLFCKGSFITSMDLIVAYLLLTEESTKLLFAKQVKEDDLLSILQWARRIYSAEEDPPKHRVNFTGEGLLDSLMDGWTLETKKYTTEISSAALKTAPSLIGREKEFAQIVEALLKKEQNSVLLVGERGSGKEYLTIALAWKSYAGTLPAPLNHKKILELLIGPLIAGAANQSELETRLQNIIEEIAHSRNVMVYIPDFENILGASSFNMNLSGALMPYLKNRTLPLIVTMTPGSYKLFLQNNSLQEAFSLVRIEESDPVAVKQMLEQKISELEETEYVSISYRALQAALTYASRYDTEIQLPGSAVALLRDTANHVSLSPTSEKAPSGKKVVLAEDVIKTLETKSRVPVAEPVGPEKELLIHLEDKLHERVIGQQEAIHVTAEALRRLRSGLTREEKPISFLFLGPTGVGKTETAKALSDLYFGGESRMIRLDMSEYTGDDGVERLLGAPPGKGEERGELTEKIHDKPSSLVLLDEFEKANPKILDLFLQVFEDGRLTDNKGRTVSFINTIIIATSNAGSEYIREHITDAQKDQKAFHHALLEQLQALHLFKPELLNRFDDIVTFMPLTVEEITIITHQMLVGISKKLQAQDITVVFDDAVVKKIVQEGYDSQFGARPLRRYIQDGIEDVLAQMKLKDEIKRGSHVTFSVCATGSLAANVS